MPSRERMRGDAFSACAAGRTVGIFRVPVRGVLCGVTSPATVRATGAAGHDALDPNSKRSSRDAGIHRRTPQALDPRGLPAEAARYLRGDLVLWSTLSVEVASYLRASLVLWSALSVPIVLRPSQNLPPLRPTTFFSLRTRKARPRSGAASLPLSPAQDGPLCEAEEVAARSPRTSTRGCIASDPLGGLLDCGPCFQARHGEDGHNRYRLP
jgi:hypothetical protein